MKVLGNRIFYVFLWFLAQGNSLVFFVVQGKEHIKMNETFKFLKENTQVILFQQLTMESQVVDRLEI